MSFDKYEKHGAYHWLGVEGITYNPRADANYLIVQRFITDHFRGREISSLRALDLACGDGVLTYRLRKLGMSVVGLDFEMLALKLARQACEKRGLPATFLKGSCDALPFADNTFDVIVAMELIEHIENPVIDGFMRELKRTVRPGGLAILTTPHKQGPVLSSPYHVQEFTAETLADRLKQAFPRVETFGYFPAFATKLYAFGGKLGMPLRLIWKALSKTGIYNPNLKMTRNPTVGWGNLIGIAYQKGKD